MAELGVEESFPGMARDEIAVDGETRNWRQAGDLSAVAVVNGLLAAHRRYPPPKGREPQPYPNTSITAVWFTGVTYTSP